ncbi:MAG: response regulator transcription factor [Ruthenibacterium sp.]
MRPILIVDDEPAIADLIEMTLVQAGYACVIAHDGKTAADLLEQNDYALVFLDIMLPEIDGYELMEYIAPLHLPVIFLTAKAALKDRVKGLRMGAEDYIVKPFEPEELLARAETVLRRAGTGNGVFTVDDVTLNTDTHTVKKNDVSILLTPREFDLLLAFLRQPNVTLYREALYESVWGQDSDVDSRTLDLHVQRIRKKLGLQNRIRTLYKIGYRLEGNP